MTKEKFEIRWAKGRPLSEGGYPGLNPRTEKADGMICDYDVAVKMRDGVEIRVDIFRPEKEEKYPVLVAWSNYGKHVNVKYAYFPKCGEADADHSKYCGFEAPEPLYWCPNGYIIIDADARGSWGSDGDLTLMSEQEAQDCYDLIEWAGTQSWSNGKVGMSGVSYLAWTQWRVASLNPPHLAAINPWEGVSDFYRELVFHGGIPETLFMSWDWLMSFWAFAKNRAEDIVEMRKEHPLFDDYWDSKNADLSKITVPAFITASWSDQGLHTRGTLEAFKKISSKDKWLRVHGRKKWQDYYLNWEKQRQFFDRFLKGIDSEVKYWPKVSLEIRERFFFGNYRSENEWPIARTQYTKFFLDASDGKMSKSPFEKEHQARYNVDDITDKTQNTKFEYTFDEKTELTGHMKLKLWVQAAGSDDMDLFVAIEKIDRTGDKVPFQFYCNHEDGPVALGWLRVSHRELNEKETTPYQPVHKHQREIKLNAGEIVPVEIEIWPSSTLFERGEKLQVIVQGSDIYSYRLPKSQIIEHASTVNKGEHVIYTGSKYDSHLLVPVIPAD
jgi:predicted acyl esterase